MIKIKKAAAFAVAAIMSVSSLFMTGCLDDLNGENVGSAYRSGNLSNDSSSDRDEDNDTDENSSDTAYTANTLDDGSFTLMIYMCATDLESNYGAATSDINEILYADISDDLNIIIQTGGTSGWQNSVMTSGVCQRFKVESGGLITLDDNIGRLNMTSPDTLADFISYSTSNYPAERYGLILWDHGGGAVFGYGYDEYYTNDSMTLDELDSALSRSGTYFSFIGFDACYMGTIETIITASKHSDYLISSENSELGEGWYYTDWISLLSSDTTADITTVGEKICSDFAKYSKEANSTFNSTLAVYDLNYVRENLIPAFDSFLSACGTQIQSGDFSTVFSLRGKAKDVGGSTSIEHIDLINYASSLETSEGEALASALKNSIVIYDTSRTGNQYQGISMYLPFSDLSSIDSMLSISESVGFCDSYSDFMTSYANALAGGHITSDPSSFSSSYDNDPSYDNSEDYDWYDESYSDDMYDYYSENSVSGELELTDMGSYYALILSDDDWSLITDANLCLYAYYGDLCIEFGNDSLFKFDDYGNLIVDFDYRWVSLNGEPVPFYCEYSEYDDDYYYVTGSVPAIVDGIYCDIIIVWDSDENPYGTVAGARPWVSDSDSLMSSRIYTISDGDEITILCYAWGDDDDGWTLYNYDDPFVVEGEIEVSYESVDEYADYEIYYRLTDIYNNYYYTESLYG